VTLTLLFVPFLSQVIRPLIVTGYLFFIWLNPYISRAFDLLILATLTLAVTSFMGFIFYVGALLIQDAYKDLLKKKETKLQGFTSIFVVSILLGALLWSWLYTSQIYDLTQRVVQA
jgi:hypothetical protein